MPCIEIFTFFWFYKSRVLKQQLFDALLCCACTTRRHQPLAMSSALPEASAFLAELAAAKAEGITLVILDSAPHSSPNASEVARLADFIVIPTRASAFDLAAAESTVKIVKASNKPFGFVLNAIDQKVAESGEALDFLQNQYGGSVAPYKVGNRIAFARSIATGQGATEFDASEGKARG
jgi:chromosome partitioning protein